MIPKVARKSFHRGFNDTVEAMANDIKDITHAVDAASVMRLFASPPRMLALGEPTHGVDAPSCCATRSSGSLSSGRATGPSPSRATVWRDCWWTTT